MSCRTRAGRLLMWVCRSRYSRVHRRGRTAKGDAAHGALEHGEEAEAGDAELAEVHALAQGIAPGEHTDEMPRQRLDDRDLEPEPQILDQDRQRIALPQQRLGALRQPCDAAPQLRRRLGRAERLYAEAASGECVKRHVGTVEIAVVCCAVL